VTQPSVTLPSARVLIAPDSFKGSLGAPEVAKALVQGIHKARPLLDCVPHPLADGGEGTLDVLASSGFELVDVSVVDHRGQKVVAQLAMRDDVVVVESAQACPFTPGASAADALSASTRGVGMMIAAALDLGLSRVYLAVGGTATTDGGAGMLSELGVRFLNHQGENIPAGGVGLVDLHSVELSGLDARLADVEVVLLSDVDNPLLGTMGAAAVFSPQKGADRAAVELLEQGLSHYADLVAPGQVQASGGGAGGGLGFAALAALHARRCSGAQEIMALTGFDKALESVSLVITGEGSFDDQSTRGKVPSVVIDAALARGIPVVVVCGVDKRSATSVTATPALSVYSLLDIEPDLDRCIDNAYELLVQVGQEIGRTI
jgi:glycerate 2-kinase